MVRPVKDDHSDAFVLADTVRIGRRRLVCSPWAAKLYNDAIARGCEHPHAVRIVARA
ncbi:MAG: hypothetical protein ACRDTA_02905 [Pseudonocardiaceae bacterium]